MINRSTGRVRRAFDALNRLFSSGGNPEDPDDPYALVGAPKKPRPPYRRATAAAQLED